MNKLASYTLLLGVAMAASSGIVPYGYKKTKVSGMTPKWSKRPKNTGMKCPYCRSRKFDNGLCKSCGKELKRRINNGN